MSDDRKAEPPRHPSEPDRGVHVSRDAPGSAGAGGRKASKLGFRVQAERRAKGDDPVFDQVRRRESPASPDSPPAAETTEASAAAAGEQDAAEQTSPGVLGRVARFFRRGTDRST